MRNCYLVNDVQVIKLFNILTQVIIRLKYLIHIFSALKPEEDTAMSDIPANESNAKPTNPQMDMNMYATRKTIAQGFYIKLLIYLI